MELRQFPVILILVGIVLSGTFLFMSNTFTTYGIQNEVSNSSLGEIVSLSTSYQNESYEIYERATLKTEGRSSILNVIDFMVFGVFKAISYTADSLSTWIGVMNLGFKEALPDSKFVGIALGGAISIFLITLAYLVISAVMKWRV